MLADDVMATILDSDSQMGPVRHQHYGLSSINRVADGTLVIGSLWFACVITGTHWSARMAIAGAVGLLLYYGLAAIKNLYRSWRTESLWLELWSTIEAWLGVTGLSLIALYAQQDQLAYPPETVLLWFLGTPFLLVAWRTAASQSARWARTRGHNLRTLAIAGSGDLAQHVARTVEDNPWMGLRILGLFDDPQGDAEGKRETIANPTRGTLDDLAQLTRRGDVDVAYLALRPGHMERKADSLIRKLSDSTASVYLVQDRRSRDPDIEQGSRQVLPDLWRLDILHRRIVDIGGIKAISVYESPFLGPDGWIKRIEDVFVSTIALILLALPMAGIAIGVKLSGPGPVFFKQRRYGLDGKEIMVWKFRSMTVCEDRGTVTQAQKGDSRITPFGRFLRSTSLDELPQFINVLLGSMSIVGPRPHAISHNEYYRDLIGGYMLRHKVKPGITGWAQVHGWRGETDSVDKMGRRVDFDLDYIRNWSLWLDMQIIVMTFFKGFIHKNAY